MSEEKKQQNMEKNSRKRPVQSTAAQFQEGVKKTQS